MKEKLIRMFKGDRKYFAIVFFIIVLIIISGIITPIFVSSTIENWEDKLSEKIIEIEDYVNNVYRERENLLLETSFELKERLRDTLSPGNISYGSLIKLVNDETYKNFSIEVIAPNGKMIAWNNDISIPQQNIFPLEYPAGETYFNTYKLVTYLTEIDTFFVENDHFYYVIALPIEKHYELQNPYFEKTSFTSEINKKYLTNFEVNYSPFAKKSKDGRKYSFDILNNQNNKIGVITFNKPTIDATLSSINSDSSAIQAFLIFIACLFLAPGFKSDFKLIKSKAIKLILILIYLTGFRYLIYILNFPSDIINGEVGEPKYFASTFGGGIVKSPIEFFITGIFLLVFCILVFRFSKRYFSENIRTNNKILFYVLFIPLMLILFWVIRGFAAAIKSVIFDSSLRYFKDPELIPNFISLFMNLNVLLIGTSITLLLLSILIILFRFSPLPNYNKNLRLYLLSFAAAEIIGILFIYLQREPLISPLLNAIIIFLIFLVGYQLLFNNLISIYNYIFIAIIASIISVAFLNYFNLELEKSSLKTAAVEINRPNDNLLHFIVDETLRGAAENNEIKRAFIRSNSNYYSTSFRIWANSELQKESLNSSVELYDKNLNKLGEFNISIDESFSPVENLSLPESNEPEIKEIAIDDNLKVISGIIPVREGNLLLGYVSASIGYSILNLEEKNIPEFLESRKNITSSVIDVAQLKIFDFINNKLTKVYGDIYPSRDQYEPIINTDFGSENDIWRTITLNGENFITYLMKTNENGDQKITAVALREKDISWNLFNFFKIFIVHSIYILLLFLVIFISQIRKFKYSFRFQLLIAFLLISIIPVIILAIYNRQVVQTRSQTTVFNELNERSNYLENHIKAQKEKHINRDYISIFENAGKELGISFGVYDNSEQIFNSKEQYYKAGLFNYKLNPEVYYQTYYLSYREYLTEERINNFNYNAFYKKLNIGDKNFVIGVNDAFNKIRLTFSSIDVDVFLFGVYSFAIIIILIISTIMANRFSLPIRKLTKATSSVAQGDLSVQLDLTEKGEMKNLFVGFNSMTKELKRNQAELAEMERESAWKEMAKQVAHEIKNPLTPMKLAVQQLKIAYDDKNKNFDSILKKVTGTLLNQIESLSSIASEFSRFAKMPRLKLEVIDLTESLNDTINLFSDENIKINFSAEFKTAKVEADNSQLKRLFINLIRNSIQANAKNIELSLSSKNEYYDVLIKDDGDGIPMEIQDKIFDPSFTTKEKGMGIGLKISKRFLEGINGNISLLKSSEVGTTFKVSMPKLKP